MKRLSIAGAALVGTLGLGIALVGSAWALIGAPESGHVAANVTVAERDVSGQSFAQLDRTLADLGVAYGGTSIDIVADERTATLPAVNIDLAVDRAETARRIIAVGRTGSLPARIGSWLRSPIRDRTPSVSLQWDNDALARAVAQVDPGPRSAPVEPQLEYRDNRLNVVPGRDGQGLSAERVAAALPDAADEGLPLRVAVEAGPLPPRFTTADLEAALATYRQTFVPLRVTAGVKTTEVGLTAVEPWLRSQVSNGSLLLSADPTAIGNDLPRLLPDAGVPVKEAAWTVSNERPVFVLGTNGSACCAAGAGSVVRDALFPPSGQPTTNVTLELTTVTPKPPPDNIDALGIKEKVGTFTTYYPAGQPRVQNIHRITELVRGAVVAPGGTFSLNDYVGPRTIEKGFVADHAIEDGKFVESVGGGISQFSTTLFNAAFFAGLEWSEYQAHTIYISRYPYGREATISFPRPDQKIKNVTPYGLLLWANYSATSVTVDIYSTKYVDAAQTGQSETKAGVCTRVTTERTRTYLDGRSVKDTVGALYQPQEGVTC